MSTTQRKTPIELYRLGVADLDRALGLVESLRCVRLLDPGSGDYTAERQTRMDQDPSTVDELCDKIRTSRTTNQSQ